MHIPSDPIDQLCTPSFRLACRTGLVEGMFPPGPERQAAGAICTACGLPTSGEPSHGKCELERAAVGHEYNRMGHQHQLLKIMAEPEAMHEEMGGVPWTAPYVWETNYLSGA